MFPELEKESRENAKVEGGSGGGGAELGVQMEARVPRAHLHHACLTSPSVVSGLAR